MKIRTNIHAGDALRDCQKQRDYWKAQADNMERIARSGSTTNWPQPQPQPQPQPVGGGWVGGVYFSDRSGWCG